MMAKIKVLSESVVNKIAAGEVIERPASVIKELVENSIDAEATRINVELEEGGKRLIRVSDDGSGMTPEDIALAFTSHATSKIESSDDLFAITTMGFRGEALPSIGSISQSRIISRSKGAAIGAEVQINGGSPGEVKAKGASEGTVVEVRNLFFNVPVRRKFLKSVTTEMNHITEAITRLALSHPHIRFDLIHNDRNVLNLPAAENRLDRIGLFFGGELRDNLIFVDAQQGSLGVQGYLATPTFDRANSKMQYVFLNERYIRDKVISHAIAQAYEGLLMSKRWPIVFLFLGIDSSQFDVNVHPTKIEVRFKVPSRIHAELLAALRKRLRQSDLSPPLQLSQDVGGIGKDLPDGNHFAQRAVEGAGRGAQPTERAAERREAAKQAIGEFLRSEGRHSPSPSEPQPWRPHAQGAYQRPSSPVDGASTEARGHESFVPKQPAPEQKAALDDSTSSQREDIASPDATAFFQIHNSYIVEETPDGLNIIDQHALHERVIRTDLEQRMKRGKVISQRLLVPQTVELSASEYSTVMNIKDPLAEMGLEIDEFGQNTIVIHSYPQIMDRCEPRQFIRDLLDELVLEDGSRNDDVKKSIDARREIMLNVVACKAAVKAGQKLCREEIRSLLEHRRELPHTATCPHGRPTTLSFSLSDLEKQFKRK